MNVFSEVTVAEGHTIEVGQATWDESATSIRNRYVTKNGGFSPRSSSELPIEDLVALMEVAASSDFLPIADCATIITALAGSVTRQLAT